MKRKDELVAEMGGCCARCGYDEFPEGLVFHHVEERGIGKAASPRSRKEIDRCVLLCANCHNALHAGKWHGEFEKAEGLGWVLIEST
jgi:hypothetical protein